MSEESSGAASGGVQVIARAAHLLRTIRDAPGGLTQAELAEALRLPRTTVFRILAALEQEGLVRPGPGKRARYRIGPEVGRLALAARRDVVTTLHSLLVEVSAEARETVDLSTFGAPGYVKFVDQVEAPHRLRAASAIGESFAMHTCAPGKALLAAIDRSDLKNYLLATLTPSTEHTITDLAALRAELARVRETGIAYDREEQSLGICAVGMAALTMGVLVAVSIPAPRQRFEGREAEYAEVLLGLRSRLLAL